MKPFAITMLSVCLIFNLIDCSTCEGKAYKNKEKVKIIEGVNEETCQHYLSLCAMFQDEGPYLKEWIEYYLMMGVEHIYLYNNNSHDNYLEILQPYIDRGILDLTEWPSPDDSNYGSRIDAVYDHCVARTLGISRWLIAIDLDEFIVPIDRPDLVSFLKDFDDSDEVGGILINWQMFGTSWMPEIPSGKLMTECLTLKAVWNHPWNTQFKSIHKPHKVKKSQCHRAHYKKGYHAVRPDGSRDKGIQLNRLQVNHYWTRASDFFYNIKIPRRERYEQKKWTIDIIHSIIVSFNVEEDRSMQRFIPELRKRVFGDK